MINQIRRNRIYSVGLMGWAQKIYQNDVLDNHHEYWQTISYRQCLQLFVVFVREPSNNMISVKINEQYKFLVWPQYFHEKQGSSRDYENLIPGLM